MRPSTLIKCAAGGAVALFVLAALSAPSQAQSTGKGDPGCAVHLGTAGLTRHHEYVKDGLTKTTTFTHDADLGSPVPHLHDVSYKTYEVKPTDLADVDVDITLGSDEVPAGSCTAYRYRLQVLDEDERLVTEVVVPGTDTGKVSWSTTVPYAYSDERFAYVQVRAETPTGRVLDTAPAAAPGVVVNLGSGGATSSFR